MPALGEAAKANFGTLLEAADNGDLALVDALDRQTGQPVQLIVAVGRDGGDYLLTPFAVLVEGNPFERYAPPLPGGGYEEVG